MSIAFAYIPEGASPEQKKTLISGIKSACCEGLGLAPAHTFVYLEEMPIENMDENARTMKCLYVWTTFGKTLDGKDKVCAGFEAACREAFGDDAGTTIVIFKEHSDENAGARGHLRPFQNKQQG